MIKNTFTIINICLNLICCYGQKTLDASTSNNIKNPMENILKEQLKFGKPQYDDFYEEYDFQEKDYSILTPYLNKILKEAGYMFPPKEVFTQKNLRIFKRKLNYNSNNRYIYINFLNKCQIRQIYHKSDIINFFGILINKEKTFISDFYSIPEIIDYQKEFPFAIDFEKNLDSIQVDKNGNKVHLYLWKDIEDLPEQRRFNKQLLISRNKYLFNEDQSQFPWLIANDEFFMESLVKTFGYTEDERLLEWVVNRTLNSTEDEEYNKIFFTKDCQGNFILHKNTFSLIQKKISEKYLESLIYNYLKKIDANKDLQSLNFEQKAEVLAYILYTGEAAAQKKFPRFLFRFMGPFYEFSKEREQYNQEFKRKNYYNLPNFKEYWEQAMIDGDGIGIPM